MNFYPSLFGSTSGNQPSKSKQEEITKAFKQHQQEQLCSMVKLQSLNKWLKGGVLYTQVSKTECKDEEGNLFPLSVVY